MFSHLLCYFPYFEEKKTQELNLYFFFLLTKLSQFISSIHDLSALEMSMKMWKLFLDKKKNEESIINYIIFLSKLTLFFACVSIISSDRKLLAWYTNWPPINSCVYTPNTRNYSTYYNRWFLVGFLKRSAFWDKILWNHY